MEEAGSPSSSLTTAKVPSEALDDCSSAANSVGSEVAVVVTDAVGSYCCLLVTFGSSSVAGSSIPKTPSTFGFSARLPTSPSESTCPTDSFSSAVVAFPVGSSSELQRRPMRRARSRSSAHDRFESFEELIGEPVVELVPG
ncbi:unnamed protein product [Linum trigynum]|uniref:Uncharacterized protein n=1 Tax=Linum trigynum TaxID=586398 RepID=A0AAV2CSZ5_9ROSI